MYKSTQEQVKKEAEKLKAHVNKEMHHLHDVAEKDIKIAKKTIHDGVENVKTFVGDGITHTKKICTDCNKKVHTFVKQNPEKSAFISLGIGAAIGAFIASIFRRK